VAGFRSIIARYPDDKLTIIVLSNDGDAPIGAVAVDGESAFRPRPANLERFL
jgi:hypothetical protein